MLLTFEKPRDKYLTLLVFLLISSVFLSPLRADDRPRRGVCDFALAASDPHWSSPVSQHLAVMESQYSALEQAHGGVVPIRDKSGHARQLLVEGYRELRRLAQERHDNLETIREMEAAKEPDLAPFKELVDARNREIDSLLSLKAPLLRNHLLKILDPAPAEKFILEIHAEGTGLDGHVFASQLLQMYQRGAADAGVQLSVLTFKPGLSQPGIAPGMESIVMGVEGPGAYDFVRYQAGRHILKSQSLTNARTFTTSVQVMVLPERPPSEFRLNESDYTLTTKTSGGPGGQNVNKTESAVVIQHKSLPISVEISDERSQHFNRVKALRIFTARVAQYYAKLESAKTAAARQAQFFSDATVRTYRNVDPTKVVDDRTGESYPYRDVISGEALANFQPALDAMRLQQLLLSSPEPSF